MIKDEEVCKKIKEINKIYIIPETKNCFEGCKDEEEYHFVMDKILIDLLEELGYIETVKMYKEAKHHFWYS